MNRKFRTESDALGHKDIPSDALYGIHSARAKENFPDCTPFPAEWYKAVGLVKLACYNTYRSFRDAAAAYPEKLAMLHVIKNEHLDALASSAAEIAEGRH